ncbi:MAG: sugar phosphate isomerase/epimerase family protein [Planctomycetota bacterium]
MRSANSKADSRSGIGVNPKASRRGFLKHSSGTAIVAAAAIASQAQADPGSNSNAEATEAKGARLSPPKFRYCLNTSTINGSKVPIREQFQIASKAGYDSVELWLRDIRRFTDEGGTLVDLRKELQDLGLGVDSAIAFGEWIVDDDARRKAGLEQCRKDMEVLAAIGGTRIAAPPKGAARGVEPRSLNLDDVGKRYRDLLEVGKQTGILPQVELWGFAANLSTLPEILYVAAAADHPDACVLLDVYHMYKGGSDFNNVGLIPGSKMHCLHMNDYPADLPRATIGDADRVYPGDGVAPMNRILQSLVRGGFEGTLSLELFNRSYWEQEPLLVAKTGIEKMRACVDRAFSQPKS